MARTRSSSWEGVSGRMGSHGVEMAASSAEARMRRAVRGVTVRPVCCGSQVVRRSALRWARPLRGSMV